MEINHLKKIYQLIFIKYCLWRNKVSKAFREIIWITSEIEAIFSSPNDKIFFRKLYLKLNDVDYQSPIWIGRNFRIFQPHNISFGRRCAFGDNVTISNHAPIQIGDDFLAASGLHINSGGHNLETLQPITEKIIIGERVWCGVNVTILHGIEIGSDVVIGANSLVCKNISSKTVVVGNPAKPIKDLQRNNCKQLWTWVR